MSLNPARTPHAFDAAMGLGERLFMGAASSHQPDTVAAMFARSAALFGGRDAVVDGQQRINYQSLNRLRLDAARAFVAAGIVKRDRIAIWAPNILEFVVAAAGLQTIGAVLVPINTRFKADEATDILRRSRARLLLTVEAFLGVRYPELIRPQDLPHLEKIVLLRGLPSAPGSLGWEEFLRSGEGIDDPTLEGLVAQVGEDDVLDLMFTSGTTGRPKGVISTHGKTVRAYRMFTAVTTLCSDDRYLIVNPFFHTFGYKYGWLASAMCGACIYPVQSFDVDATLALIAREKITLMPGPPTIYQVILSHPRRDAYDLSSLRFGQTGAAMIPVPLIDAMRRELKLKFVLTGYGLTESCGLATSTDPDDDAVTVATTVGRALPGIELRIAGADGSEMPAGQPGEILLRGDNVMVGYFEDDAATAAAIDRDGFLHTGDIGTLDEHGYLRITDRLKDVYIVGGFNCYPAELENLLYGLPGVIQAAVIGVADERLGEVGKAFIVAQPNAGLSEASVISWCRERIANFKVPRQVQFVDSLPLNASGKILKSELRKAPWSGHA